ncbi:MAG: site-2 protease family protein, partial [Thermoguttaceae bacterium]
DQDGLTPVPDGDGTVPAEAEGVLDAPLNPFEELVLGELEKIRNPKGNWVQTVVILAVSLLLFVGLGMRDHPVAFTAMLVGVLFFHELGHYVGMRIFGYRNVRMFFIPLFGAAVSGQKTSAKSYQEAIVTLLGPLPGLCLAAVLFGMAFVPGFGREHRLVLVQASLLLGFINGFNLLPIFPLDGGRLLNQILFSRNRYLEGIFQFLAALALIAFGATGGGMFLCVLGVLLLGGINPTFQTNTIARHIRELLGDQMPPVNEPIPLPIFRAIVAAVQSRLPRATNAKGIANSVFRIWEKMHVQPTGATATVLLLLVYLLAGVLTVPWILPLFFHVPKR